MRSMHPQAIVRHTAVYRISLSITLAAIAALLSLSAATRPALASPQDRPTYMERKVSLDLRDTTLGAALDQLMKQAHVSYTLDCLLSKAPIGAIYLEKQPFRLALNVLLKAADKPITYRIESGIVMVNPSPEEAAAQGAVDETAAPKAQKEKPVVHTQVSRSSGHPDELRITLNAQNATLASILKALFTRADRSYSLDPAVGDIVVTASIRNAPLSQVLHAILSGSGTPLTYSIENGVYSITKKP